MGTELAKFYRAVDNPIGDEFASMPVLIKFGVMSELLHILSEEFFEMSLLEIRNILIKRLVYRLVCRKIDNAEDLEGHSARYFQNRVFYDALKTLIQNGWVNQAEDEKQKTYRISQLGNVFVDELTGYRLGVRRLINNSDFENGIGNLLEDHRIEEWSDPCTGTLESGSLPRLSGI